MSTRWFTVRSWLEADKVRVVVLAVSKDKTETQIATALLHEGERRDFPQAEKYGAAPVTVSVNKDAPGR